MRSGRRPSPIAVTISGARPAFNAAGACAFHSYCWVQWRAVTRIATPRHPPQCKFARQGSQVHRSCENGSRSSNAARNHPSSKAGGVSPIEAGIRFGRPDLRTLRASALMIRRVRLGIYYLCVGWPIGNLKRLLQKTVCSAVATFSPPISSPSPSIRKGELSGNATFESLRNDILVGPLYPCFTASARIPLQSASVQRSVDW